MVKKTELAKSARSNSVAMAAYWASHLLPVVISWSSVYLKDVEMAIEKSGAEWTVSLSRLVPQN